MLSVICFFCENGNAVQMSHFTLVAANSVFVLEISKAWLKKNVHWVFFHQKLTMVIFFFNIEGTAG